MAQGPGDPVAAAPSGQVPERFWTPLVIYVAVAVATLGMAAAISSSNMITDQPNKDMWQHVAAVRALMENLSNPQNPFVTTTEPSRHFQPLWVVTAAVGNALNLTVWQAVTGATYAIMATFAVAVHVFARALFGSPWAPTVLLSVLMFGWWLPYAHTGLHSIWTLLYGAGYPATFMIALSLLQWAVVIRALQGRRYLPALAALSALMLATHQLGAVIGFIGAVSFAIAQPDVPVRARLGVLAAIGLGSVCALAWPYFNPVRLILSPGNSSYDGAPNFYASPWMPEMLAPAALGLLWFRHRAARPLALALVLYTGAYLVGLAGAQVASRFLMPLVLVLHVGLAGVFLEVTARVTLPGARLSRLAPWVAAAGVIALSAHAVTAYLGTVEATYRAAPDIYASAERLVLDVPDTEAVAAQGLTAWPVVASGQRVLSVPWPEPGIADLAQRQAMTAALFDPRQSPAARRELAASLGIRVLLVDRRFGPPDMLAALAAGAASSRQDGMLLRIDLWP